ncbi:aldo/keto reductase [candidate division KSB1 bacterium]
MSDGMDRRKFLKITSGTAALGLMGCASLGRSAGKSGGVLPTRALGNTGQRVTMLAFGGGSALSAVEDDNDAVELIHYAFDSGIRYFDTGHNYGGGQSEIRYGMALNDRRDKIFLSSKFSPDGTKDETLFAIEESLRRLRTDHLDLGQMHGLTDMETPEKMLRKDGAVEALREMQSQGVIKLVGITSHLHPPAIKKAMELEDFDNVICTMNAARHPFEFAYEEGQAPDAAFQDSVLTLAGQKKMGISAIKVMGQRRLLGDGPGRAKPADLLRYTLSLPVTAAIVGMSRKSDVDQNIALVKDFKPMPAAEMKRMESAISYGPAALNLPYLRPGYVDDGHLDPYLA